MKKTVYAGTYTGKTSKGIYSFTFEDGIVSGPDLFCEIGNPKYLSEIGESLLTVFDDERGAGAALVSDDGKVTDSVIYEDETSCFIAADGDTVVSANYHAGTVTMLKLKDGKLELVKKKEIRKGAGCHQVLFDGERILVPCLLLDKVVVFDRDLEVTGEILFEKGTGPRHGVFTKDHTYLYLTSELSNELFVIRMSDLKVIRQISVLGGDGRFGKDGAAIRLSDDEKYVYVSTRTLDLISVIRMDDHRPEFIQKKGCGGEHPRDFILLDGYLLSANRFSNSVTCFRLDEDGTVGEMTSSVQVPEAVALWVK